MLSEKNSQSLDKKRDVRYLTFLEIILTSLKLINNNRFD